MASYEAQLWQEQIRNEALRSKINRLKIEIRRLERVVLEIELSKEDD
jgi:hypothetical protein